MDVGPRWPNVSGRYYGAVSRLGKWKTVESFAKLNRQPADIWRLRYPAIAASESVPPRPVPDGNYEPFRLKTIPGESKFAVRRTDLVRQSSGRRFGRQVSLFGFKKHFSA